ncbi:MAG: hypothetical protein JXQ73_00200 [Phycisphaerae bacterium]|nr:hypothetical protein [Phycisphaerae bacterium]
MTSVMHTALGGMLRNQKGLEVTAQNIANVNTDGYRAQRVDGATGQVSPASDLPPERPEDWPESHPYNDVDLTRELVHMKTYEIGYTANAKVVATTDRLLGELMDTLA